MRCDSCGAEYNGKSHTCGWLGAVRDFHTCRCRGCPDCDKDPSGRCKRVEDTMVCGACWQHVPRPPKYPPDTEYE